MEFIRCTHFLLCSQNSFFLKRFHVKEQFLTECFTLMNQDLSVWPTLALAFQTLGVVYGDMGTSPLYVFSDVFSKVPIESEVDVLGALSLVMYTIALLPFAKYVFIVLKANDNGEGMGFPYILYAMIFWHIIHLLIIRYQSKLQEEHLPYIL